MTRNHLTLLILLLWLMPLATLKLVYLAGILLLLTIWRYRARCTVPLLLCAGLSAGYLLIYQNGPALIENAYRFNAVYYAPYSGLTGISPVELPLLGIVHFAGALVRVTQAPPSVLMLPFVFALWGYWITRRRWRDAFLLTALVMLSYPQAEQHFTADFHFTTHYMVLTGIAAYAIGEVWRGAAVGAGAPARHGMERENG